MINDKDGSPECGIYVRIGDFSNMQEIITKFRQMTMVINRASGYEKNMNIVEFVYDKSHVQEISDLVMLAQNEGIVAIISGSPPDFECYGADGILLDNADDIKAAREKLGDDAIIGVACGSSRDLAQDIDYVTISADPALISWWKAQTEILCVAMGDKITSNNCGVLASAGASFVEVSNYIFNYEKGTMQATVNILHTLECAAQVPETLN